MLPVNKLQGSASLTRLVLDGFYINDLHILFNGYPSLAHLTVHRLLVNFHGFLPPFDTPIDTLHTLKLNCDFTVRFEYIAYMLSFVRALRHLTLIAIGLDFLDLEQWTAVLAPLEQLRVLTLDLKAVDELFGDELAASLLAGYCGRWPIAVDYSDDNKKFHVFTVPYRRSSFISTIHNRAIVHAPRDAFHTVTDVYLKKNAPSEVVRRVLRQSRKVDVCNRT